MLAIDIELLFGRYHATTWGRAANEGDVEWPPSPWRLGRALVSAWYRTPADRRPDETQLNALLAAISRPPRFLIPHGAVAHTRHYMPEDGGRSTTSSPVLDAFVTVASPHVLAVWNDIEVTPETRAHLKTLVEGISYLGRAESACLVSVVDEVPAGLLTSEPFDESVGESTDEVVNILCLSEETTTAALSESTAERRKRRLDSPAAGRWVPYVRPHRALEPRRGAVQTRRPVRPIHVMRFALDGRALPPVTEALRLTELYRSAALRRVDDTNTEAVGRLRGRTSDTEPPYEGHRHCHYLATDEDGDGRLDHLTVWCPDGLGAAERAALDVETLSSAWRFEHPLHLVLIESRAGDDLPDEGPTATSRRWASHTPFVPTRRPKRRGGVLTDGFGDQVVAELRSRGLPLPERIELRPSGRRSWGAFRSERESGRRERHGLPALGWSLVFPAAVAGPISLGRLSHFGLGLFLPDAGG